jgi:peroxiredoxin
LKRNIVIPLLMGFAIVAMLWMAVREAHRRNPDQQLQALGAKANGKMAPDFELQTLDGKPLKLSQLRGKAVLVNFWATWCPPCKVEMPWFEEFQKQYQDRGFTIVGVAMDDAAPQEIAKFTESMGITYPVVLGTNAVSDTYGADYLPTSVFIDRNGVIVQRVFGLVNRRDIEDDIQKALGTATAGAAPAATAAQHP